MTEKKMRARKLQVYRFLSGMSQDQLAQKMGVDQALVSRIERNARKPTKDQKRKLAQIFHVPVEEIFPEELREK